MMGEKREPRRKQRGEGRRLEREEGGRQRAGHRPDPSERQAGGRGPQTSSHWYPRQLPTEAGSQHACARLPQPLGRKWAFLGWGLRRAERGQAGEAASRISLYPEKSLLGRKTP